MVYDTAQFSSLNLKLAELFELAEKMREAGVISHGIRPHARQMSHTFAVDLYAIEREKSRGREEVHFKTSGTHLFAP